MNKNRCALLLLILWIFVYRLNAQQKPYEGIVAKGDTIGKAITLYGGLVHQHQNFFGKPFSFQGVEVGFSIKHKLSIGAYASTFASTLAVKQSANPMFVYIGQGGVLLGVMQDNRKFLPVGFLLSIGYFSLIADESDFSLFRAENPLVKRSGLILSPQIYTELTIIKWMKFRPGLAYSFYNFHDQSIIKKADLQNVSLSFGFIFGKFK